MIYDIHIPIPSIFRCSCQQIRLYMSRKLNDNNNNNNKTR
jgi:hypothetical protein